MNELIEKLKDKGYKIKLDPPTIYVPFGTEDKDISEEMKILRKEFKFMIQIEIV